MVSRKWKLINFDATHFYYEEKSIVFAVAAFFGYKDWLPNESSAAGRPSLNGFGGGVHLHHRIKWEMRQSPPRAGGGSGVDVSVSGAGEFLIYDRKV